jgi:cell division transport system ATP-binding protein
MQIFKSFHQVGATLILSTHDERVMQQFPSRALHLQKGALQGNTR